MSRIGMMRERPSLQAPTVAHTDAGDPVSTWATVATFWARVEPKTSSELVRALTQVVERRWTLTTRYRTDLSADRRILWKGRFFEIGGDMNVDERGQFISVDLTEVKPTTAVA